MATAAPKLKNKRLSDYNRQTLFTHARKLVEASEGSETVDAAYKSAATVVRAAVEREFPPKDMRVLLKYEAARSDACIYASGGSGHYTEFCFRDDDKAPVRPRRGGCGRRAFALDDNAMDAVLAFEREQQARKERIDSRLGDYKALIYSVSSFNEVANVWPEAEALRESIVGTGTALTVLNNDVVSRIQSDAAQRLSKLVEAV